MQSFAIGDRLKQVLIHMVRVISEWAPARHEFLARIPVLLSMQIEKEIDGIEKNLSPSR